MAGVKAGTLEIEILTNMARLQEEMRQIEKSVGNMSTGVARSTKAANDNIGSIGKTSGLAKHHVQNLAFQFQDLGIQLTAAAQSSKPFQGAMMALFQQGTQIQGVMSQAGIGVGGLIAQIGRFVLAAAPAIAAIGAISAAVGLVTSEINENSKVTVTWQDTLLGTYDALKKYLTDQLTGAFKAFGLETSNVWKDVVNAAKWGINWIIGAMTVVPRVLRDTWSLIPAGVADIFVTAANGAIRAVNAMVAKTVEILNGFISSANVILGKVGLDLPKLAAPQIGELQNSYAGAGAKLGTAFMGAIRDTVTRDYLGDAAAAISPFAQARAVERMKKDAKKAGKEAGKALRDGAEDELKKLLASLEGTFAIYRDAAKTTGKMLDKQLDRDWQRMFDEMADKQRKASQAAVDAADANAAWNDELRRTIELLDQIGGFASILANIGAVIEGFSSGDFSGVRGPLGGLLGLVGSTDEGKQAIKDLGVVFRDALDGVFGGEGSFTKALKAASVGVAAGQMVFGSKNSGIGSAVGGVLGEVAGKAIGKSVGGLLGKVGGPLGSIVGGILGGALGSLFKTVKTGFAVVSNTGVTSGGSSSELASSSKSSGTGIQAAIQNIADQLGGSVGNYSVSIGKRSSGWISVSASGSSQVADKNWKKRNVGGDLIYDGKDEAEALRVALLNAIRDGAIQGVRAGTAALLKKDGDIETQLNKALKFEGVFTSLKQMTDPVGYALQQLTKEFEGLKKIFDEAGATAAEYADLEKLLNLQKQEAIDKAAAEVRQKALEAVNDPLKLQIRILELLGKGEDAVAAARIMELASLKSSLQPLQAMVYQLEDAKAVIDQFGPLADDLRAYRKELLGGSTTMGLAYLAGQFRSTAASAAGGDATALGQLRSVSGQYLDAAKENAASALDYQRAVSEVLAAVDRGLFAADAQVDYAQAQIDAIENTANIMQSMKTELVTLQKQVADTSATTLKLWQRFEINGLPVNNDAGPVQVEVVS
ncbi:hypothetical protein Saro_0660 [Novosphingobium aromaticivorans DSM 12444]|uniref:Bacteriophage tail tape measure N-terminal domain-containing protein n=1 Tax=Novosphingobium aromaticivorans (strain ATCC 700278 / DSM 12444 / CCUG 56034 / CIP 105152 / NBRC 16084 / F199) TaxID=279238 RepID=Q2GAL6_NOVAD|nr:hypothetical protein [Novosphingobium aromaticivorans]ABD25107.1 hypothetical protein Saro_0660 [Novosphingobium aromaticivorans DSM 12444]SCY95753.1 hypothetical protein SAMN05660666_03876 [Novosphingobium aromaticivorans]